MSRTFILVLITLTISALTPSTSDAQSYEEPKYDRLDAPDIPLSIRYASIDRVGDRLALLLFDQGIMYSEDEGQTWSESDFSAGYDSKILVGNDGNYYMFYTGCIRNEYSNFYRSTDRGNTWEYIAFIGMCFRGVVHEDNIIFSTFYGNLRYNTSTSTLDTLTRWSEPYIWTQDSSGVVYAVNDSLYYSDDGAVTWHGMRDTSGIGRIEAMRYMRGALYITTRDGIFEYNIQSSALTQLSAWYKSGKLVVNEATGKVCIVNTKIFYLNSTTNSLDSISVVTRFGEERVADALPADDGGWYVATQYGYFYKIDSTGSQVEELSRPYYAFDQISILYGGTHIVALDHGLGLLLEGELYITDDDGDTWTDYGSVPLQYDNYIYEGSGAFTYQSYDSAGIYLARYDVTDKSDVLLTRLPKDYRFMLSSPTFGEYFFSKYTYTDLDTLAMWSEATNQFTFYTPGGDGVGIAAYNPTAGLFVSVYHQEGFNRLLKYSSITQQWEDVTPDSLFLTFYLSTKGTLFAFGYNTVYISEDGGKTWEDNQPEYYRFHSLSDACFSETPDGDVMMSTGITFYFYLASEKRWKSAYVRLECDYVYQSIIAEDRSVYFLSGGGINKFRNKYPVPVQLTSTPSAFTLSQSYPNPVHVSGTVTIPYELPLGGDAVLTVYDIHGRVVERREVSGATPGAQSATVTLAGHPAGVYMYTLSAGGAVQSRKMVVVR